MCVVVFSCEEILLVDVFHSFVIKRFDEGKQMFSVLRGTLSLGKCSY